MNRTQAAIVIFLFIGLTVLPAAAPAQEPPVSRSVSYTLEPGEEILQAESRILICVDKVDVILIISKEKKGPFFVVRDGKKHGPFAKLDDAMEAAYEGKESPCKEDNDCAEYQPVEPPEGTGLSTESDGKERQILRFKGKTFGPYLMVFSTRETRDGARVYFTASNKDKAWFGDTDGRKTSFGGIPEDFKFSPDGKNAAAVVTGTLTMGDMEKAASLPPEKLEENLNTKFLYTIDGKKFGPFGQDFSSSSFWYPATSNDLYYQFGGQLFRNGTPFLKADWVDPCAFYPTADGKAYALITYENVAFSDGKKFPFPLDLSVYQENGKTVFKWISLENKKDLVIYKRTM